MAQVSGESTRRLLAIDPGVVNLAYCVLEWEAASAPPTELSLTLLQEAMRAGHLRILELSVLPLLSTGRNGSINAVLAGTVDFLLTRSNMIRSLHSVVIEQQMKASMKQVAACLYGGLRALCPNVTVTMQSASLKLAFGDLAAFVPSDPSTGAVSLSTYAQRKRAAVAVATRLRDVMPASLAESYMASKKKDDLADALLHGLAGFCAAVPKTRTRTAPAAKRACTSRAAAAVV